jgi:hypothetical protein
MEEMPGDLLGVDADDVTDAFLEGVDGDVEETGKGRRRQGQEFASLLSCSEPPP